MNEFIEFCNKMSQLDETTITELERILKLKHVNKNEYLAYSNKHSKELLFIRKGIVKFCFNGDGKEFIMRFFEENILFLEMEKTEYSIINHCRWDNYLDILPSLLFKKTFKKYVLDNFYVNNVGAQPILYKLV
ncbi:hypothetical protein [Algoriphagus sp. NG3]|uniref:hypothetical protein n=1 Tax=Algoriphagus sp. NG3 TaxID=3097546 RepID=UPI002A839A6E|nr:hypothetical protein [Algoriphagus sp. NG3]WPR75753.1 hypothetical protein SLW71_00120 [Algoriphagus sp. NG3]